MAVILPETRSFDTIGPWDEPLTLTPESPTGEGLLRGSRIPDDARTRFGDLKQNRTTHWQVQDR